jgi:hypothetical protein
MITRSRVTAVILAIFFMAQFYPAATARSEPLEFHNKSSAFAELAAISLPRKDGLNVLSVFRVRVGGEIVGHLVAYDNAATARQTDYLELYDNRGSLLAVSWFDRFGIERVAVDPALAEEGQQLEGGLVLLVTGETI